MDTLSPETRERLEGLRKRIRSMSFEPMPERERAALPQRRREGRANSAIEGIHLTAEEVAFLDLLDEERVPYELRIALATLFALGEDRSAAAD